LAASPAGAFALNSFPMFGPTLPQDALFGKTEASTAWALADAR
jgi:hypothetical protein